MKTIVEKKQTKRPAKSTEHKTEELKTDSPISEKDEVKKAEQRLQKNTRR